jgi:hypothetical protein
VSDELELDERPSSYESRKDANGLEEGGGEDYLL